MIAKLFSVLVAVVLLYLPQSAMSSMSARMFSVLPLFESHAEQAMKVWDVPGMAVAIVEGNQIVFAKGWGVREYGKKLPVTPDTVFQIGSITKSFTTLLIGMQVDESKLSFTDRVIDHLPTFRTADPWVTRQFLIEDLLAQRSGLPVCGGDLQVMFGNTREQVINNIRHIEPVSSFRSNFAYQNNFFLVASALVEKQTGIPWQKHVKDRIFTPLGLKQTFATSGEFLAVTNRAAQHQRLNSTIMILPDNWPYQFAVETFGPAGAISSSIRDLATYMALHMNMGQLGGKRLVAEETMDHIHSPKTPLNHDKTGDRKFYCQGLILSTHSGRELIWHNGGTPGGNSMMMFDPEAQVGIVILSNMQGTKLPDTLALDFFDIYQGKSVGDSTARTAQAMQKGNHDTKPPDGPTVPVPARQLQAYEGNYTNSLCGPVKVSVINGQLTATLGTIALAHEMHHHNGDTFWLALPMVDVDASGFASFVFDPEGNATRLVIDAFRDNAIPPFERTNTF